jgi:hypothetical protein
VTAIFGELLEDPCIHKVAHLLACPSVLKACTRRHGLWIKLIVAAFVDGCGNLETIGIAE